MPDGGSVWVFALEQWVCFKKSTLRRKLVFTIHSASGHWDLVEVALRGPANEYIDIRRFTWQYPIGVNTVSAGEPGDLLLGAQSSRRNAREVLARGHGNDVASAGGNWTAEESNGPSPSGPVTPDESGGNQEWRPVIQREGLPRRCSTARKRSPRHEPPAIRRKSAEVQNWAGDNLVCSSPIWSRLVNERGTPLRVTVENLAFRSEGRLATFNVGNLLRRGVPV